MTNNHPLAIFSGTQSSDLSAKIATYLRNRMNDAEQLRLGKADCRPFTNGECMVRVTTNVRERDVFLIQSVCRQRNSSESNPHTGINDCLMELLVWGDALTLASADRVTAVIPSFGYARQDRKAASRTPITARLVCDLIQEAGFDRVLTMDLHSDQIQGFFSRNGCKLDHLNAGSLFANHFGQIENAVVLSPDVGNLKKANKYRKGMLAKTGISVIDKYRDPETGLVVSQRITGDNVKGKNCIILDDIISTGGTMRSAIEVAIDAGAKDFYIGATHGEFVGNAIEKLKHPRIKEIVVTDTIPMLPEVGNQLPIKILSTAELFGEAILRIHEGMSISELLGEFS